MTPRPYYRLDTLLVSRDVLAVHAHRKRRHHHPGADGYMRDTFLRLFQAAVVERNVEPAVPEDADPSSGSIPGGWYRGTGHGGV